MRLFGCCLIGLLTAACAVSAQGVAQPAAAENIDTVLRGWEKSMTDLKNFSCVVKRESLDKALQAKDTFEGYALFQKAFIKNDGSKARLELKNVKNPESFEKYICTGILLYEYAPANKVVRIHDMPNAKKGNNQQESFLSFLFGMGSEQAKTRYQMDLLVSKGPPDKFYHYIRVQPKLPADKSDFTEARLSLYRATNLPAQIWYHQPNGNEITWNFTKVQTDHEKLDRRYFEPEELKGWTWQRVTPKTPLSVTPTVRGGNP